MALLGAEEASEKELWPSILGFRVQGLDILRSRGRGHANVAVRIQSCHGFDGLEELYTHGLEFRV